MRIDIEMLEKIAIITAIIIVIFFLIFGYAGYQNWSGQEKSGSGFENIDVQTAKQMIDDRDTFLLDVRTNAEFNDGHIEGATLIPVGELNSRLDEVPEDKDIVVYCRSGRRSVTASNILVDAGYGDVYNILGGINSWKSAGYPVVVPE